MGYEPIELLKDEDVMQILGIKDKRTLEKNAFKVSILLDMAEPIDTL